MSLTLARTSDDKIIVVGEGAASELMVPPSMAGKTTGDNVPAVKRAGGVAEGDITNVYTTGSGATLKVLYFVAP